MTVMPEWQDQGTEWQGLLFCLRSQRSELQSWVALPSQLGSRNKWHSYYTLPLDSHWVQTIHGKEIRPGKGLSLVETVSLVEHNRETSAAHTLSSWEDERLSPKRGEDDVWA